MGSKINLSFKIFAYCKLTYMNMNSTQCILSHLLSETGRCWIFYPGWGIVDFFGLVGFLELLAPSLAVPYLYTPGILLDSLFVFFL